MQPRTPLFTDHPRRFDENRYVYPVVSRRARGVSIGVNLNADKACNFDCVYCSVDRTVPAPPWAREPIDVERLSRELGSLLDEVGSSALFDQPPFDETPAALRRLNDVALSGDGEPTSSPAFGEALRACRRALDERRLDGVKLIVLTNGTLLDRPEVQAALATLDGRAAEIWAKLDAGTEAYFREVDRAHAPLSRVLANLLATGRRRPLVVQALFARLHGEGPPAAEVEAWLGRLAALRDGGCRIERVQVYTSARRPAEPWVAPLSDAALDAIVARVAALGLPAEAFYGPAAGA